MINDPLLKYKIIAFSCILFYIIIVPKIDIASILLLVILLLCVIFDNSINIPHKEYIFIAPLLGYAIRILLINEDSK